MDTKNVSTLKIHKLTQAQYDREFAAGRIDDNALYLTPDEEIDLSPYATKIDLDKKANSSHTHAISDVTNLQASLDAKQATISGGASTITSSNLTANRALVSNGSGKVAVSSVASTELECLEGVTGGIQAQLDDKVPMSRKVNGKALTGDITLSASDVGASASGHTHSDYVNQNAFGKITVGDSTYTAEKPVSDVGFKQGDGISLSYTLGKDADIDITVTNAGVRSISTGTSNGTISVNTGGSTANVAVKGLGSAAYTNSEDYATASHGTHVTWSTTTPKMDGTASVGSETKVAKGDHVHPTDTTRASQTALDELSDVVSGKANKATSLSGYGITDAYTKTQVDNIANGKANTSHGNHVPAIETANNAKFLRNDNTWATVTPENIGAATSSHGTHVSYSSTAPVMDGTASVGSASTVARSDHKHPTDTSRAAQTSLDSHTGNTTAHITSTERTNWNKAYTHSTADHAPSNAEKNQNAYSSFVFTNASSTYASAPSDSDGSFEVFAGTTTSSMSFVAGNNLIEFDPIDGSQRDEVTIYVHADPAGSADEALDNAKSYTDTKIANLINGAPTTLDTLGEIATAMKTNEDVVKALDTAIGTKANASDLTSHTGNTSNPHGVTKTQLSLGNVENKSSATIRSEITKSNVTTALGYTPYTPSEVDGLLAKKSDTSHTHKYAGSSSVGGAATSANKVNSSLTVKLNGGSTEGTNLFTFNGSEAKEINITPSTVGASAAGHTHDDRYYTESEIDEKLNGKANSSHGTHVSYGTSASALGTSSAGSASTVSRSDHVHALPALTSCTGTLTVAKGGTGATTAAGAITNLGAMDLSSAQTVSGVKTFSNGIKIGNSATISWDSTNNAIKFTFE